MPAESLRDLPDRSEYSAAILGRDIFAMHSDPTVITTEVLPLKATLLATVVASDPAESSALIQLSSHTGGFGVGDQLTDRTTLIGIQPRQVVVQYDNTLHTLTLKSGYAGDPDATAPNAHQDRISRSDITALLEQGSGLRVAPHRDTLGEVDGFRISGIRRETLLHRLGVKNGDVVHSINGMPIDSLSAALSAQEALAAATASSCLLAEGGPDAHLNGRRVPVRGKGGGAVRVE